MGRRESQGDAMNRKPIFDAVRDLLGRPFTQADVKELDQAIDSAEASLPGTVAPAPKPVLPAGPRQLGQAGIDLIEGFEGCAKRRDDGRFDAYPDPGTGGDPWTIGWGSTGQDIAKGVIWTQAECDDRFAQDMQRYADQVSHAIGDAPTTQNQFDALVSFHYNTGAIATATLTKLHKQGRFAEAAKEFGKWVHAGHKILPGLVKRRAAEAALYAKP
jgi:GH24 family phage-related lysozyme (muramidase)